VIIYRMTDRYAPRARILTLTKGPMPEAEMRQISKRRLA
jgi:hypothetical protein